MEETYNKEDVINILMVRDKLSKEEAIDLVQETQEEINDLIDTDPSLDELEDIIAMNFGLEPDYLMDFLRC